MALDIDLLSRKIQAFLDKEFDINRGEWFFWWDTSKNGFYGKKHSEEIKIKMGEINRKKVLCIQTGKIFNSATELAKEYGKSPSWAWTKCRKGKDFMYIEEENNG